MSHSVRHAVYGQGAAAVPNSAQMVHDAFISYSSRDKPVADATCAALEASGIRCWIAPRDINPGMEWGEAIIDAISQCRVMILIFSANANSSPQIRREVERAVSKGIPIIPLRIEDVAPARSLEYFIGTVHWLDALTPPMEAHLQRLVESVQAILRLNPAWQPIIVGSKAPATNTPPVNPSKRPDRRTMILGALATTAAGIGLWWLLVPKSVQPVIPPASAIVSNSPPQSPAESQAQVATQPQPRAGTKTPAQSASEPQPQAPATSRGQPASIPGGGSLVDPALIGTFDYSTVVDGYDMHFVLSIKANGTYQMVSTSDESGTYQAGNGMFRTVGAKTGRVRSGTYRAAGAAAIAVTSGTATVIYRPSQPTAPVNQANPVMLGAWQGTALIAGIPWTVTLQNNPDGTFSFHGRGEDHGSCTYLNQQWRVTSAVSGQSDAGTYQTIDANTLQASGSGGNITWHRQ